MPREFRATPIENAQWRVRAHRTPGRGNTTGSYKLEENGFNDIIKNDNSGARRHVTALSRTQPDHIHSAGCGPLPIGSPDPPRPGCRASRGRHPRTRIAQPAQGLGAARFRRSVPCSASLHINPRALWLLAIFSAKLAPHSATGRRPLPSQFDDFRRPVLATREIQRDPMLAIAVEKGDPVRVRHRRSLPSAHPIWATTACQTWAEPARWNAAPPTAAPRPTP